MIFFWKYVERILKKLTWMLKPQMLFASSFKDPEDLLGHPTIIYFVSSRVFGKVLTEYWVSVVHSNLKSVGRILTTVMSSQQRFYYSQILPVVTTE